VRVNSPARGFHTLSAKLSTPRFSPALSKRMVSLGLAVPGGHVAVAASALAPRPAFASLRRASEQARHSFSDGGRPLPTTRTARGGRGDEPRSRRRGIERDAPGFLRFPAVGPHGDFDILIERRQHAHQTFQ
jgi:hypothetical protein